MRVYLLTIVTFFINITSWSQINPIEQTNDLKIYYDCQGQNCD